MMKKILIADSYYLNRSRLYSIVSRQMDYEIVCQTMDSNRLVSDVRYYQPEIVVMDIHMQPTSGVVNLSENGLLTQCRFLLLASLPSDPMIVQLLKAGGAGCIIKDSIDESLLPAIQEVLDGGSPISPQIASHLLIYLRNIKSDFPDACTNTTSLSHRESMVLRLLSEGLPNKMIGTELDISERTVEAHVRNILRKLNATSRTHAAFLATKNGWLT
jgi:two-component system, NarL family, nitrate/nitrite response regulator NarL